MKKSEKRKRETPKEKAQRKLMEIRLLRRRYGFAAIAGFIVLTVGTVIIVAKFGFYPAGYALLPAIVILILGVIIGEISDQKAIRKWEAILEDREDDEDDENDDDDSEE